MKKFEFRLASVLRLRDTQLMAEKLKLQELFGERERLRKNLASIEVERSESVEWMQKNPNPGSSDLRALSAFLLGSKARERTLQQAVESCSVDIDEQRKRAMEAEREQKLLLKLKEQRLATWQYAADQELEIIAQEAWQSAARKKGRP